MSLSSGELSAADVAAVVGNNGNGFGSLMGDGGIWIMVMAEEHILLFSRDLIRPLL